MLAHAKFPKKYWAESVAVTAYLKNITPTRVLDNSIPKENFDHRSPSYRNLRTFGCLAYVHAPKSKKWYSVSHPCVFVGCTATKKKYWFIGIRTNKIVVSATATFREGQGCSTQNDVLEVIKAGSRGKESNVVAVDPTPVNSISDGQGNVESVPSGRRRPFGNTFYKFSKVTSSFYSTETIEMSTCGHWRCWRCRRYVFFNGGRFPIVVRRSD